MNVKFAIALLAASVTLIGYFISNFLERWRSVRLRELEFRLDRYKEFLLAFSDLSGNPTYETQLRFVSSVNVILLIGSAGLLKAVKKLVENYNDEEGTEETQRPILDEIVLRMRCDLNAADSKKLAKFEFPIIVPDLKPKKGSKTSSASAN